MFRPQFLYPTPQGASDLPYVRPVVIGQDVGGTVPAGGYLRDYVIPLDNDAPSLFRSLFIEGIQQGQDSELQIQIRDAYGNYITDGFVPVSLLAWGAGNTPPDGGSGRAKVFEPELYCPEGSILILDFFNPGSSAVGLPIFGRPVQMSTSHAAINMTNYEIGGQGQGAPVIQFNNALYQVLQYVSPPYPGGGGSINVFKSTDNGATWTRLDFANSPLHSPTFGQPSGGVYFDGIQTITVASTLGEISAAVADPILLQDFNLQTETWGPVYGAGSPNVYQTNQVWKRTDGSILVIGVNTISGGAASGMRAYVLAAGAWTSFSLTASFPGGWTVIPCSACVLDVSTQIIHLFGRASTAGPVHHQYYEQILPNNTVAGFQDLTGVYGDFTAYGNPLLLNGKILLGVSDVTSSFATILIGSPIATPVFAVAPSPGINPAQPIPGYVSTLTPTLATDGTRLWAIFLNDTAESQVWLSFTDNLFNPDIGWVGGLAYDDTFGDFATDAQYPSIAIINGLPALTIQGQGTPTAFFMIPISSGFNIQYPGWMEFRGVKRYPEGCLQ